MDKNDLYVIFQLYCGAWESNSVHKTVLVGTFVIPYSSDFVNHSPKNQTTLTIIETLML